MNKQKIIKKLNEMEKGDNEELHSRADSLLILFLMENGHSDLATAWNNAAARVGFWYA